MNKRRGLLRVWVVLAAVCWGIAGYAAYNAYPDFKRFGRSDSYVREMLARPTQYEADGVTIKATEAAVNKALIEAQLKTVAQRKEAVKQLHWAMWVMAFPLLAFPLYWIGNWIVRGFRSAKQPTRRD